MRRDVYPSAEDLPTHGEPGVLAHDEVADLIQCHACGRWFQKLTARHLALHALSIAEYKERYGLNATTALETPRITNLRRRKNAEHESWRNLVTDYRFTPGAPRTPRETRAQFRREHYSSQEQRRRGREWSDEEMLAALRGLQEAHGGILRQEHLVRERPGGRGTSPSRTTVIERFGSWRQVCALLGQPYRMGRPRTSGVWANNGHLYRALPTAYRAALRLPGGLEGGRRALLAPGGVDGLTRQAVLWTDGPSYRVYEDAPDGGGMAQALPVPPEWTGRRDGDQKSGEE